MGEETSSVLRLSLETALAATVLASSAALPAAWWMARRRFRGKVAIEAILLMPLVLPPTVVGYLLLVVLGNASPLGRMAESLFGWRFAFSWEAAVVAAAVVAFPLIYLTAQSAFAAIDTTLISAARTLGARKTRRFFHVAVGLAWPGIVAAVVLGYARALGEFGATLMVAGNIPGHTRTIPLAIFVEAESGNLAGAAAWVAVTFVLTFAIALAAGHLSTGWRPRRRAASPPRPVAAVPVAARAPERAQLDAAVRKRLGAFSLDVRLATSGRVTSIVGASGAGKSLLLRCLSGLDVPDEGHVRLGERVLFSSRDGRWAPPERRGVGHVFQNYALFPHMTVFRNVAFGLHGLDESELRRRVWEALDACELAETATRYPDELSGGQQQRVALARAMVLRPALLLLDEPLSAVDDNLRFRLAHWLHHRVREDAGSTIFVTHHLEDAYRLGDELVVLDGGRVIAAGEKRAVLDNPGTLRAAELTGCKNLLEASAAPGGTEAYVPALGLTLKLARAAPSGISHVGIRAHHVEVGTEPGGRENELRCRVAEWTETPHRYTLKLQPEGRQTAPAPASLYAEIPRASWDRIASAACWWMRLPPERILALTS